ncbi:MAG: zinc ABC transporter substrate-binding protein, partial [Chloroflexota bacterium]
EFVEWLGFHVAATYDRPDSLTPEVVQRLVDKGREDNVRYVIDNLQTGKHAGEGIAEALGAFGVTLSDFPGGHKNTDTWEQTIDRNIGLMLGAESPR